MDENHVVRPDKSALDRICEEVFELPKQPDEFTALEVSERTGIEYKTTMNRLSRMEKNGILTSRMGRNENNHVAKLFKYTDHGNK
jgi:predicted transcriptional regulator